MEAHFFGRDRDYAAYFLNTLHRHALTRHGKFKRFNRKILVQTIPEHRFTQIRDKLVALGVIEVNHSYQAGSRSKGYRLKPKYVKSRKVSCRTEFLSRKILARRRDRERQLLPVHKWLRSKFDVLSFDLKCAAKIMPTMKPKPGSTLTDREYQDLLDEICNRRLPSRHISVCKYGRVHSSITSLPKALRSCLRVDGEQLVGIDITSSQPLLVGLIAKRHWESADARHRMLTRDFDDRSTPYVVQEIEGMSQRIANGSGDGDTQTNETLSIMCYKSALSPEKTGANGGDRVQSGAIPADLVEYLRLCESGQLYEHLQVPGQTRERTKVELFTVFYGKAGMWNPLMRQLSTEFPTVAAMLRALKRKSYQHPARLMQSYESTMVIAIICGRLMRERPNIPIFTIHDSILTTPAHVEYVKSVMQEEFGKIGKCRLRED